MTDTSTQDDQQQDQQGTGEDSPTADRVPEPGADVDEGEVHGDASQLDTDVEKRIDEAGSAQDRGADESDDSGSDANADGGPDVDPEQVEQERQERLDPENRPKNAEVDNSARDFDIEKGQFTDHEVDDAVGPFNDPTSPDGEIEA